MLDRKAKWLLYMYEHLFSSFLKRGEHAQHQFCIGDGWYAIISDICRDVTRLKNRANWNDIIIKFDCLQLKEKLGGLRFYYTLDIEGESKASIKFRKFDNWFRIQMCKRGLYKPYWAFFRFRRKYIYETLYEKVGSIVSRGESKSYETCEVCGGPGKRCNPSSFWILTLCEKHNEVAKKEKD